MALPKPVKIKNIDVLNDPIKVTEYCTTTHEYCTYITHLISDNVINKNNIPEHLIKRYINLVCDQMLCWSLNYDKHLKNIKYILENINFDNIIVKNINNNNELINLFVGTMKDINLQFIKEVSKNQEIFTTLVENFINSNQYIDDIFEYSLNKKYDKTLNLLLDNKFKIETEEKFFKIVVQFNSSNNIVNIIKKCIANGYNITKNTVHNLLMLNNYYKTNYDKIIIFLYDNGSTNFNILDILKPLNRFDVDISNIVNHLIDNNYAITEKEFLTLCEKKIKIKNISKIKHFFDNKEIKNAIYNNRIDYPINFEFNIEILRNECHSGDLARVKNILKTVNPDITCLEYACLGTNSSIIKLLHETYNIKFSDQCIINTIQQQSQRYNRLMRYVNDRYTLKNPLQQNANVINNYNDNESDGDGNGNGNGYGDSDDDNYDDI
jgi:hypothetical protein